jgi:hypothetical protein
MARIASLNILLDPTGKDYLAELYGQVIANVQKGTISSRLKNTNLSGNPVSGSVEAKRLAFATSKDYGTARAAGKGDAVKAKPVTVQINQDRELVEEMEEKDTTMYGVDGLVQRRSAEHQMAMTRELETAFFAKAAEVATEVTTTATDPLDVFEAAVLQVETTKNEYVNGVPRSMIHVIMKPSEYSKIRNKINTGVYNANVDSSIEEFGRLNGVMVYSSIDLPSDVTHIAMCEGSVAQPVRVRKFDAEKVPLSDAIALELFFNYGIEAVMPDLIAKVSNP